MSLTRSLRTCLQVLGACCGHWSPPHTQNQSLLLGGLQSMGHQCCCLMRDPLLLLSSQPHMWPRSLSCLVLSRVEVFGGGGQGHVLAHCFTCPHGALVRDSAQHACAMLCEAESARGIWQTLEISRKACSCAMVVLGTGVACLPHFATLLALQLQQCPRKKRASALACASEWWAGQGNDLQQWILMYVRVCYSALLVLLFAV
jgi:hypothetical protein